MPTRPLTDISKLSLDLSNYRTVPQPDETHAVQAMIAVSPDRFWALIESLLESGYLPTENVIVLRSSNPNSLTVKEGNRRVGALKLIHGFLPITSFDVPENIADSIKKVSGAWKKANLKVPCSIYAAKDAAIVDRIVDLAHGKGEKAGKDKWSSVARARHNREENRAKEPGLDLLEKYIEKGKNLTSTQSERWAGSYPLSVLDEMMRVWATRFGVKNPTELASAYPNKIQHRTALEEIMLDIGLGCVDI